MTAFTALLAGLAALALVVTKTLDIIKSFLHVDHPAFWQTLALVVGVAYCVGWQINVTAQALALVPALAEHSSKLSGVAGEVLTGLTAGAFAGFWHEVLDSLRASAGKNPETPPAM